MSISDYPCPCCGYFVFNDPPGSYDICPICFWEDDIFQLRFPMTTGANHVSLIQAQQNCARDGVSELRFHAHARPPKEFELRDPDWRPIDVTKDSIEQTVSDVDYGDTYPEDSTRLYYWR